MMASSFAATLGAALPPPPSRQAVYRTTVTTTVDETVTTWTGVAIGPEHPDRVVLLITFLGVAALSTGYPRVNRTPPLRWTRQNEIVISTHRCPGTTATIEVSSTGSVRKAAMVWTVYPGVDAVCKFSVGTANTTTDLIFTNFKACAGGSMIWGASQLATVGAFGTTWPGSGTVTEDVDAQLEAASTYAGGRVTGITASSDTLSLTIAETVSGTKRGAAVSFPPARLGW